MTGTADPSATATDWNGPGSATHRGSQALPAPNASAAMRRVRDTRAFDRAVWSEAPSPWTIDRRRAQNVRLWKSLSQDAQDALRAGRQSMSNSKQSDLNSLEMVAGNGLI